MDNNLEYEARTFGDLGNWYEGPWTQRETADGSYEVVHSATGTVLATLPDFAGPIALWMCVARDAFPVLLKEAAQQRQDNFREAARILREHPSTAYDRLLGEVNLARRSA
jgi:acyl-CoA reductase-like NAD-dependent aldehyde dehydrogenase